MITVFLAVYGWIIAALCAACWWHTERRLKQALHREELYITMVGDQYQDLKPSIAALKAARIIPPVLLLLCLPTWAHAQTAPIIIGNVADIVSTEYAVRHGAHEMNPVMAGGTAQRIALKSASTVLSVYLVQKLGQRHPRMAKVLGYSIGGTLSMVAVHNFHQVRR